MSENVVKIADRKQMTDAQLADEIRSAIASVTKLMNIAKDRNISVIFNIPETELSNKKKIFAEVVDIKKIEPL